VAISTDQTNTGGEADAVIQRDRRSAAPVQGPLPLDLMPGWRALGILVLEWLKAGPGQLPRPAFSHSLD